MTSDATKTALALRDEPQAVMLTPQQIQVIANTEFVPTSMRGNVPKVLACVARGRAMGIPDMVALNGIDIIEGRATLSAELMVAIVRAHGHSIRGEATAERAIVSGRRSDNGDTMTAEFNLEMAERAGLLNRSNWKRHPDDMMWARAVSKLCRRLFADCFAGGTYAPDDLQPTADETDEPLDPEPEPENPAGERPATQPQKNAIFALMAELELDDRETRLHYTSTVIGRNISSSNELTISEAGQLIDELHAVKALPPEERAHRLAGQQTLT